VTKLPLTKERQGGGKKNDQKKKEGRKDWETRTTMEKRTGDGAALKKGGGQEKLQWMGKTRNWQP